MEFFENITQIIDSSLWVDVIIYLNFSNAFNYVPCKWLTAKLSAIGTKDNLYDWLKFFILSWKEVVTVQEQDPSLNLD